MRLDYKQPPNKPLERPGMNARAGIDAEAPAAQRRAVRQAGASVIAIRRVDENGVTEATFPDPEALDQLLASDVPDDTCCLRFIDPYGDTTFNGLQLPVLASELRVAAAGVSKALRERVEALVAFVEAAEKEVHTYVKFIGD